MFREKKKSYIHFIGIGGIGMSGIAEVLIRLGYQVSGSDLGENAITKNLKSLGAKVFKGHQESNLQEDCSVVVYSSAIDEKNPEIVEARKRRIPLIRRAEMLAELMRLKYGVAIAGTHGKTTTTSFLATILHEAGVDPTHIIGGVVENLGGNARLGSSDFLVAEADESDGSFLLLNPVLSVITNIDDDHLDFYKTRENLVESFHKFANKVPFYGCVALNAHDEELFSMSNTIKRPCVLFGIKEDLKSDIELDYGASDVKSSVEGTEFDLSYKGEKIDRFVIHMPGNHNILNALGAIAISHQMEIPFDKIKKAVKKFFGVGRRFQVLRSKGPKIIDDYGHHPTEVAKTIKTAKELHQEKLIVFFEPHRYSRTKQCWDQFLHSFNHADEVYMLPIYAASEKEVAGINSTALVRDLNQLHPNLATYVEGYDKLTEIIKENKDAVFLSLGAGSIGREIRRIVAELS